MKPYQNYTREELVDLIVDQKMEIQRLKETNMELRVELSFQKQEHEDQK